MRRASYDAHEFQIIRAVVNSPTINIRQVFESMPHVTTEDLKNFNVRRDTYERELHDWHCLDSGCNCDFADGSLRVRIASTDLFDSFRALSIRYCGTRTVTSLRLAPREENGTS